MVLRSREYIYLDMAKKKTKSSYKYYVAFRYIEYSAVSVPSVSL